MLFGNLPKAIRVSTEHFLRHRLTRSSVWVSGRGPEILSVYVVARNSNGPRGRTLPDIWAIREQDSLLHKTTREPVQLTAGPVHFENLIPSSDGKTIFAIGIIG